MPEERFANLERRRQRLVGLISLWWRSTKWDASRVCISHEENYLSVKSIFPVNTFLTDYFEPWLSTANYLKYMISNINFCKCKPYRPSKPAWSRTSNYMYTVVYSTTYCSVKCRAQGIEEGNIQKKKAKVVADAVWGT